MLDKKVQMNVGISKNLKSFAINYAKTKFHSLYQYIEKLVSEERELKQMEVKQKV